MEREYPIFWFTPQVVAVAGGWTRLKPGAGNSIWVSYVGGGGPGAWAIFSCFPTGTGGERDQKCSCCNLNQFLQVLQEVG